jgi:hypothetical protein
LKRAFETFTSVPAVIASMQEFAMTVPVTARSGMQIAFPRCSTFLF